MAERGVANQMVWLRFALFLVCLATASGCTSGQRPFREVQFCLANVREIPSFIKMMNSVSQEYGMNFVDRSTESEMELRSLKISKFPIPSPVINISATRSHDFSFGATNIGLPTTLVLIGFNGNDITEARTFADAVVKKISLRWRIHDVATERTILPLSNCN